ncbi:hypothetical protein RHMOL_Rhmol06G0128900 [Rhododendron molle]|uniref:Uncharacterized protein n=1 Tax=Rhododendron molle TaxID=49168 RepID=A0ACC0NBK9_RHOML|nr:hypothetical protein RHMOL_Rhmol06G0128900 [Rhododendron molle]
MGLNPDGLLCVHHAMAEAGSRAKPKCVHNKRKMISLRTYLRRIERVGRAAEDVAHGEEEVELLVADLQQVLGVELDRKCAGEVLHPLDDIEAAVLAEDLEVEAAAGESYKIRALRREIFMQPPR